MPHNEITFITSLLYSNDGLMAKSMSLYTNTKSKIPYKLAFLNLIAFLLQAYVLTKIDFYEINDIENAGKYIREYNDPTRILSPLFLYHFESFL